MSALYYLTTAPKSADFESRDVQRLWDRCFSVSGVEWGLVKAKDVEVGAKLLLHYVAGGFMVLPADLALFLLAPACSAFEAHEALHPVNWLGLVPVAHGSAAWAVVQAFTMGYHGGLLPPDNGLVSFRLLKDRFEGCGLTFTLSNAYAFGEKCGGEARKALRGLFEAPAVSDVGHNVRLTQHPPHCPKCGGEHFLESPCPAAAKFRVAENAAREKVAS